MFIIYIVYWTINTSVKIVMQLNLVFKACHTYLHTLEQNVPYQMPVSLFN